MNLIIEMVLLGCNLVPLMVILRKECNQEVEIELINHKIDDINFELKKIERIAESGKCSFLTQEKPKR